ncbi:MAG: DoxX family protein [Novosphingobium sp.]
MSPPALRRTGITLTVLIGLFLAMDAGGKLFAPALMIANSPPLGLPVDEGFHRMLGAILALGLVLYLIPRTAVLGAIVLTGYLGGAVAIHTRIGSPLLSHTLFGVYLGVILWAALWCRLPALRALIPFRKGV